IAVRLQAAIERIELGRLAIGLRVDARRQTITLAPQTLGITPGVGQGFSDAPVGLGLDAFAFGRALGAQLVGTRAEALLHALVHRTADLVRQIDALHAHVDELDAQALGGLTGTAEHVAGEYGALGDDNFLQRAARHHALDAVLDVLAQSRRGIVRVASSGTVVLRGVEHTPLHVEIDNQRLV